MLYAIEMDALETLEETTPSFFQNPLEWLMNKATELGRQRREEVQEWADHKANQNIQQYLNDNPEIAARAKSNADMGLASGTISPAVYEMLQQVETTHNHTPAPDASMSVDSPAMSKGKGLEIT